MITAIGLEPEARHAGLWFRIQREYFDSAAVCEFLVDVMTDLPGNPILVLDNWNVREAAARKLDDRLEETSTGVDVEFLPTHAPDLNPVEAIWEKTKSSDVANYAPTDLDALEQRVRQAITERKEQRDLLRSWFEFAGLTL